MFTASLEAWVWRLLRGLAEAQYNLGVMYLTGQGITRDDVQAYKWFALAVGTYTTRAERDEAGKARDSIVAHMTPAQLGEAQKLVHEWKKQ